MLVYRLQHERFNDVIGQDGHIMMAKAIHALETLLYSESLENRYFKSIQFNFGMQSYWFLIQYKLVFFRPK